MRRMLCLCNTYLKYTRVIRKDRVYPILNNWYDDKSKMKTVVEDRKSSHRLDDYRWSWLGCTPKRMEIVGGRPDVLGDGWICEESASGFVQTQNGLVNGLCVWHRIYSVWHANMQWSGLLLKSKVLWWWSKHGLCGVALCNVYLACFTPGMNQKRERTSGRTCVSF